MYDKMAGAADEETNTFLALLSGIPASAASTNKISVVYPL